MLLYMICIRKKERREQEKDMKYIVKLKAVRKIGSRKYKIGFSKAYVISNTFSGILSISVFLNDSFQFLPLLYLSLWSAL